MVKEIDDDYCKKCKILDTIINIATNNTYDVYYRLELIISNIEEYCDGIQ